MKALNSMIPGAPTNPTATPKSLSRLSLLVFLAGCGPAAPEKPAADRSIRSEILAGATFTTFDALQGGCQDSPNGINCNNYRAKNDVYLSGGPSHAGVSDGPYFFAVLTPGSQNGGVVEGARGNLSDTLVGGTVGDNGAGDDISNRTFTVTNHEISSYTGTHLTGTTPNGRFVVEAFPYDDTDNSGGVYILAVCQLGATQPAQCKFDAFRIAPPAGDGGVVVIPFPVVAGGKYYDANANGSWDLGEVGIAGWPIDFTDGLSDTVSTDANGVFSLSMLADTYRFSERLAPSPWTQTGNLTSQIVTTGGAVASLAGDKSYSVAAIDGSTVQGVFFGNLCIGSGGGLTIGFWSNKNGQALIGADDLALLRTLSLRNADGTNFDPNDSRTFRTWILNATATNMAVMLSAQLASMELNVLNGFVSSGSLLYAPGAVSSNANGFTSVGALMTEADAALAANGNTVAPSAGRTYQEALKTALDNANNNRTFVQVGPAFCPVPVFP